MATIERSHMVSESLNPPQLHPVLSPQRQTFSGLNSVGLSSKPRRLTPDAAPHPPQVKPAPHLNLDTTCTYDARPPPVATTDDSGLAPSPKPTTLDLALTTPLPPDETPRTDVHVPASSPAETADETRIALPHKTSFREHRNRKHRKNAYSIDSVPRQTLLKAQLSRPAMQSLVMPDQDKGLAQQPPQSLADALSKMNMQSDDSAASKMAALASPCFFHKKFDQAVNIDKVLEEIAGDETISHSRLVRTATGVREVSKQLQRRPIRMTVRNIMIVTKARDNELVHLTRELAEWLLCTPRNGSDVGVNVYVDHKLRKSKRFDIDTLLAKDPRFENMLRFWTPELCWTHPEKFDLVLTLGGDGTVLFTSWLFQRIVPPILSFSLGSLGFLTNFDFSQYKEALDKIMGDAGMRVNLRMRFTCTVYRHQKHTAPGGPQYIEAEQFEVLNELVIDRGPSPYVSQLELYGDDNLLTVVQADGCIFSTPTGSTAYSLSAGGALVHPDIPAILLTPICPHTLSFRPMLLNDSMLLRVAVPRNSRATAYCAFDGKGRVELRQGDHVTIAASQYPFPTVLSQPTEWFDSLSRTLRWNNRGAQQKAWDGEVKEGENEFDIDFDNEDVDSGYSAEGSSSGGHDSPIRKGVVLPFLLQQ
jgi:NAD+ kinase